jgi:mannose/fructose/N-acetylgalactosamine-specific phosphotransferase system component IID
LLEERRKVLDRGKIFKALGVCLAASGLAVGAVVYFLKKKQD